MSNYETGVEQAPQPEVPAGYETVPVEMFDYGFNLDLNALAVGDSVAFDAENTGEEPHELVLVALPEDLDLQGKLEAGGQPEGVEDIAFTFANPGQTGIAIAETRWRPAATP